MSETTPSSAAEFPTIDDCRIVDLPHILSPQGSLTPLYALEHIPFCVARTYFLYDIPGGASRGGHAHKILEQFIVAPMGAFDLLLDDGRRRKRIRLERPYYGVYIPRMIWRELVDFSSGAICLSFASHPYDADEYIRDHQQYRQDIAR